MTNRTLKLLDDCVIVGLGSSLQPGAPFVAAPVVVRVGSDDTTVFEIRSYAGDFGDGRVIPRYDWDYLVESEEADRFPEQPVRKGDEVWVIREQMMPWYSQVKDDVKLCGALRRELTVRSDCFAWLVDGEAAIEVRYQWASSFAFSALLACSKDNHEEAESFAWLAFYVEPRNGYVGWEALYHVVRAAKGDAAARRLCLPDHFRRRASRD